MKKILICLLTGLVMVGFNSCGHKSNNDDDDDDDDTTVMRHHPGYDICDSDTVVNIDIQEKVQQPERAKIFIADFSATWCGPCQQLKPYFEDMERRYGDRAIFQTYDIDDYPEMAEYYNIEGVPTIIIFSDDSMTQELRRVVGFDPEGIEDAINDYLYY